MLITTQDEFSRFVDRARTARLLCIDTEFLREKTYYAKLCLLQLSTDEEIVVVDPLKVRDLSPLAELFTNESIVKVLHAGTQDIEILYHLLGVMPSPVFDTQIAATLLTGSQQIGYGALVAQICGVSLKKSDSYTDWSVRPLSESQLEYAADDVRYLPRMYDYIMKQFDVDNRVEWLQADFDNLIDPAKYEIDPRDRYRKLKRASHLSRQQMSAAREVSAWREDQARKRDLPRKWVITDEQVVEACRKEARTIDDLFAIRGMREKLNTRDARLVASLIAKGLDLPESEWPAPDKPKKNMPNVDVQIDLFTAVARIRARENNVALQTLAPHADMERIARGEREGVSLLTGWRKHMLGDELVELAEGRIALSIQDGVLREEPSSAPARRTHRVSRTAGKTVKH